MFNVNKPEDKNLTNLTNKELEAKESLSQFADNTKEGFADVADDVKTSANDLGDKLQRQAKQTKEEAYHVIASLKSLLAQYTDSFRAGEIKDQIVDKAVELKGVVQNEMAHAKDRTVQTVHDKPIVSLAVALGAGVLLGYILGTKQNSDK
ncbi:MAG TPA: hypothetical protein VES38_09400 [Methylotenera sp.]|nr:hypothetical protein [Methylotenera sp.]